MTSLYVLASLDDLGVEHRTGFWGVEPEGGAGGQLVHVVRNGDIRPSGLVNTATCPVRRFKAREVQDSELRMGDVLVTTSGEPGKSAYWGGTEGFAASNFVRRLRAPDAAIGKYLFYYLRSQHSREAFVRHSRGVAIKNLSRQFWDELRIPVRGVRDVVATVAAIESHLTRLDDTVVSLERVQAKLKAYRASVLKAAIEGRLVPTEASLSRAEKRAYEPAEALLARILKDRRRRWEEGELRKFMAAGKTPTHDKWKANYDEPLPPDTSKLPELPEGWCWASWPQVGFSQNGRAFPSAEYQDTGVRLLRPGNLHESGRVEWNKKNTRHMPVRWASDHSAYLVGPDELVINLTAQSLADEFLGRVCLTAAGEHCLLNQRIARLTPVLLSTRFLLCVFKAPWFRNFVASLNTGSLIQHMFTTQLEDFVLPLPPLVEQERIAAEVERRSTLSEFCATSAMLSIRRVQALRQAVLKWAFEGKLADRDPNDEPAAKLFARIKAQRPAVAPAKKTLRRRARGAA